MCPEYVPASRTHFVHKDKMRKREPSEQIKISFLALITLYVVVLCMRARARRTLRTAHVLFCVVFCDFSFSVFRRLVYFLLNSCFFRSLVFFYFSFNFFAGTIRCIMRTEYGGVCLTIVTALPPLTFSTLHRLTSHSILIHSNFELPRVYGALTPDREHI